MTTPIGGSSVGHPAPHGARDADRDGGELERDRPQLGRRDRQRRRHRLPDPALPGRPLHQLRPVAPGRRHHHHLQRHRPHRQHQLRLQVRALDAAGNLGPLSNAATATTQTSTDTTPPTAPAHSPQLPPAQHKSTSPGAPPPTTSQSPATASTAAKAPAAPTSHTSPNSPAPARPTPTPDWPRARPTATKSAPSTSRQPRPLLKPSLRDDLLVRVGRGIFVRRGHWHNRCRFVRERQYRDDLERNLDGRRQVWAALTFKGRTPRVNVPNSTSLQLNSGMTLEAWVNPASSRAHGAT